MAKYVVGVCPDSQDVEVVAVEAENDLEAMAESIFKYSENLGTREDWDLPPTNENLPYKTVDEGIDFFLQGGVSLSKPRLVSEL